MAGDKIPTERDLAAKLGISRNTVSAAYKELLLEGILEARQGRGTFVRRQREDDAALEQVAGSRRDRLLRVIDDAMAKAVELGFTTEQFVAIASIRAQEKARAVKALRVSVVDCTAENVRHFIRQLNQVANVHFEAVVLSDLLEQRVPVELLRSSDLVVTTAEHQTALVKLMGPSNKLFVAAVTPNLDAVVKLARLLPGATVGVVAETKEFTDALKRLFTRIAASEIFCEMLLSADREELRRFTLRHNVLVVAKEMEHAVRQAAAADQVIIPFYYEIDQGSLHQVMAKMLEMIS
ncbi:transcription regulator hth gntr [Lucifera butyrica]|uniref:Transcription regulator hth gntr n=1 Tax=Lucifera butyrica TaxID=1351585 RepID=A0A498R4Z1_9FIRM|nr:transcription regulator hth gntr [Lucifera butyrica]